MSKQISLITVLVERLTFFSKAPFFWENLCGNTQNTFLDKFSLKGCSIFSNLFSINDLLFKNGLLPIKISYQYFQVFLLAHLFLYWLWLTCFISWCHFKLYSLFTLIHYKSSKLFYLFVQRKNKYVQLSVKIHFSSSTYLWPAILIEEI